MTKKLTYITLQEKAGIKRVKEPVSFGLPLPKGLVKNPKQLVILDSQESQLTSQWEPTLLWPDGSLKWVLGNFLADLKPGEKKNYAIALVETHSKLKSSFVIRQTENEININNGQTSILISKLSSFLENIFLNSTPLFAKTKWQVIGSKDKETSLKIKSLAIEESGPLKVVIGIKGQISSPKRDLHLLFYQRFTFWAGLSLVKIEFTVRNPRRAKHKGGYWDLGDPGSMYIKDLSLVLWPSQPAETILFSTETSNPFQETGPPLEVYQDSSGGKLWQSPVHVNKDGIVPITFKGYRLKAGHSETYGLRASPLVKILTKDKTEISLAVPYFWQNFPKAIKVEKDLVRLSLFPEEFNDLHEIQGGEQKTHEFWLAFGDEKYPAPELAWTYSPITPILDPNWISQTEAVLYFSENQGDKNYNKITQEAVEGKNSFFVKREKIDEYGWRNFGDVYADHETIFHKGKRPLVSHYNNQYDLIYSFLIQFLHTGDIRWFNLGHELARHVYDIDVYHTKEDKPAYNNGLFWHTFHYVDAYRSTHRCYSRDAGITGGGPSNEHLYSSGLLLYYLLTGDPRAKEVVIKFGEHVIEMDKPLKFLRWLDNSPSGLASQTRDPWYHGPGRGAGNSINCLLDAYQLTRDRKFLAKAEELIRRCIHPRDDIEARELRKPEERWSYTVFLQVLGKYLLLKHEWNELDYMFAYGRESLLHYARWMAKNEYIYLDKPELLEYPTETWAAQEIRKAEVFNLAAYFSSATNERKLFLEKAKFFYQESLERLLSFSTWSFTRPLAIILQSGFSFYWFEKLAPPKWPEENYDFGEPENFVPQKIRVKKKLLWWKR